MGYDKSIEFSKSERWEPSSTKAPTPSQKENFKIIITAIVNFFKSMPLGCDIIYDRFDVLLFDLSTHRVISQPLLEANPKILSTYILYDKVSKRCYCCPEKLGDAGLRAAQEYLFENIEYDVQWIAVEENEWIQLDSQVKNSAGAKRKPSYNTSIASTPTGETAEEMRRRRAREDEENIKKEKLPEYSLSELAKFLSQITGRLLKLEDTLNEMRDKMEEKAYHDKKAMLEYAERLKEHIKKENTKKEILEQEIALRHAQGEE
jgi:hypothetical protein